MRFKLSKQDCSGGHLLPAFVGVELECIFDFLSVFANHTHENSDLLCFSFVDTLVLMSNSTPFCVSASPCFSQILWAGEIHFTLSSVFVNTEIFDTPDNMQYMSYNVLPHSQIYKD